MIDAMTVKKEAPGHSKPKQTKVGKYPLFLKFSLKLQYHHNNYVSFDNNISLVNEADTVCAKLALKSIKIESSPI